MGFFSCVPTSRMALTYRKKIQKEGNATIDELEQNVAQALYDLEQGSDLKSEMKYLFILSAKEVTVAPNKSAIVVVIPFRQITQFPESTLVLSTSWRRSSPRTSSSSRNVAFCKDLVATTV